MSLDTDSGPDWPANELHAELLDMRENGSGLSLQVESLLIGVFVLSQTVEAAEEPGVKIRC